MSTQPDHDPPLTKDELIEQARQGAMADRLQSQQPQVQQPQVQQPKASQPQKQSSGDSSWGPIIGWILIIIVIVFLTRSCGSQHHSYGTGSYVFLLVPACYRYILSPLRHFLSHTLGHFLVRQGSKEGDNLWGQ